MTARNRMARWALAVMCTTLLVGCGPGPTARLQTCEHQRNALALRVDAGDVHLLADRLSSTDVHGDKIIQEPSAGNADYVSRLVKVPRLGPWVEQSIEPAPSLQAVELDLHAAVSRLSSQPPLVSTQCLVSCGPWVSRIEGDRLVVRLPSAGLADGNVLVISAFVQSCELVGAVSWGLVFMTP